MRVIVVAGQPGSGKTTLVNAVLARMGPKRPVKHGLLRGEFYARRGLLTLGIYDGSTFAGTDRLSMGVMPDALRFLTEGLNRLPGLKTVLVEGDRLLTSDFIERLAEPSEELNLVKLEVDPEEVARRRQARGGKQNASWVAGRVTKVERIAQEFGFESWPHTTPAEMNANLRRLLALV